MIIRNIALATLVACVALSVVSQAHAAEIEPFTITNDTRWQSYPRISGDRVVYNSNSGGSATSYDLNVDGYNILSENYFGVDLDGTRDYAPCVSGPYVTWVKQVGSNSHIYARNVVSGAIYPVCTESGTRGLPQVSGSTVVWYDARDGKKAIYGYDLSSPGEFVIVADNANSFGKMGLDGNILVYEDRRSGSRVDIYAHNLSTHAESLVSDGVNSASDPDVSGNTAVYHSYRSGKSNVYAANITTGAEFPVTATSSWSHLPKIDGNIVVWSDNRTGQNNIYGKNLATGYEFMISSSNAMERWSDISGDIVVWQNEAVLYRNNIWGARLNIPNMFLQGTFDAGAMGTWTKSGAGTANAIVDPHDPANYCLELLTGSPVTVTHTVSTPDRIFDIIFDYEFTTTSGTLAIELDGQLIDTLNAPAVLTGDFESYSVRVAGLGLQGLDDVPLAFTLDETGGTPSGVLLDGIDFQSIPEPATLATLALGALAIFRKRRR